MLYKSHIIIHNNKIEKNNTPFDVNEIMDQLKTINKFNL